MDKFMLCPLLSGYSFAPSNNLLEQPLLGGMPRQRVVFFGGVQIVNATVICRSPEEVDYFWAFWRKKQRLPETWLWALKTDSFDFEEHECKFSASSLPQESERGGSIIKFSFQIYVVPKNRPIELDDKIIDFWQAGMNPHTSNLLDKLVNEEMPKALR